MEHPSISRQHAAIQFNAGGEAFIYDLSTHGSRVNKKAPSPRPRPRKGATSAGGARRLTVLADAGRRRAGQTLKPRVYARLRVGDVLHLGQSTRLLIFSGPDDMLEPVEGGWGSEKRATKEAALAAKMAKTHALRAEVFARAAARARAHRGGRAVS
jgi:hypothetical protein